ncbi:MAG: ATP synthase F1 subunit gamma [Firmicutes bacterium]|nr:ATP synthase F1 subunit gamma [Bacillota bacterium]
MPSMKAIKRRRLTVKNISQITKAMNLVATSKLQRARNALAAVAEPVRATFDIVYNTVSHPDALEHPLMQMRDPVKNTAYVVFSANRGLCGGYNSGVCKELIRHAKQQDSNPIIIPVGTKGRDYLRRRNYNVMEFSPASDTASYEDAHTISDLLVEMYTKGQVDEVYVVYTKFVTILNLEPIVRKVLPVDPAYLRRVVADNLPEGETWEDLGFFPKPVSKPATNSQIEFEPGLEEVLANVVPWYLSMFMYAAMTSAILCEHAARMTSMDSSTKNATEIIDKLTLQFNRQRQSIITQEITEIVSGANALR